MTDELNHQVVVVTGGTRGIGAAISNRFAKHGARVQMVYRKNTEEAHSHLINMPGQGHHLYQYDLSDTESLQQLVADIISKCGHIDIWVNNAGIGYHHPIDKVSFDEWKSSWKQIIDVNLLAPAYSCYHVAQQMIRRGKGRIMNVSSRGAFRGEPLMPAYGASKAGLNAMTQSLAYALAPYGLFVGAVAPGFVETEMSRPRLQGKVGEHIKAQSPMNRVAHPDEVAQAVILMAQANQWMTGSVFDVNGASYFRM